MGSEALRKVQKSPRRALYRHGLVASEAKYPNQKHIPDGMPMQGIPWAHNPRQWRLEWSPRL